MFAVLKKGIHGIVNNPIQFLIIQTIINEITKKENSQYKIRLTLNNTIKVKNAFYHSYLKKDI